MLERPQLLAGLRGCASRAAPARAAARRTPRIRPRTSTRTAPSRRGSGAASCRRRRTSAGISASNSSNQRRRRRRRGRTPTSGRARSGAPRGASRPPCPHGHSTGTVTIRLASHRRTEECSGDRTRGRAERLAAGGEGVGPRPRGPARDLPQHARHPRRRGARAHPLPPGQDPGLVLHRPRQRGLGRRRRDRDGARRRRHAAAPRHGRAHHARRRAVADLRAVHGPRGRPDARTRRQRAHGRRAPRADRDGQPPAGDAPGRGRLRARVPHPRGEARRGRLVRRGRDGARRRARGR